MIENPIRILCVDDNELVCGALERKFTTDRGFEWCGSLPDASRLLEWAKEHRPNVVLLDVDMPGPDPVVVLRKLSTSLPEVRTVVLSGHISQSLLDRVFAAGAWGYLSKGDDSTTIVDSVRRVASGEFVLGPEVQVVCDRLPQFGQRSAG